MTTHDEFDLLRRLRALPREREPQRDLWAGIETRIGVASAPRRRYTGWIGLAAAAVLVLVVGVNWRMAPTTIPAPVAQDSAPAPVNDEIRREADAITLEYRLALEPYAAAPLPPQLQAAATELDASAKELRLALRDQPDAAYLLDRLRHTYDQRLKLVQRTLG